MRTITIDGRLGKDVDVQTSKNGRQYARLRVANTEFIEGKDDTAWYDVISFDDRVISSMKPYLTKGVGVYVSGQLTSKINISDGKPYINNYIKAFTIEFPTINSKKSENNNGSSNPFVSENASSTYKPTIETTYVPQVETVAVGATSGGFEASFTSSTQEDDELPF